MARIILETTDVKFTVETTTLDYGEAVDPQGTLWILKDRPSNLPGEQWESDEGETAWRV